MEKYYLVFTSFEFKIEVSMKIRQEMKMLMVYLAGSFRCQPV